MKPDHGARDHAQWSASASARNFACPGAIALISSLGIEDKTSRAAAWGTACHQVAEHCLREDQDAAEFVGRSVKAEPFTFEFDDEMAECTQEFLDYVRGRITEYDLAGLQEEKWCGATLLIEQKFDLAPINPPMQAGGTGDVVMLFPAWGLIEIVDLKTGMGYVDANENKQLRTYALGAMLANAGSWDKVRATIVQPRVGKQAVRYEEIDIVDLFDWTQDLKGAMAESAEAIKAAPKNGLVAGAKISEAWTATFLVPGDHCDKTFCPARSTCPALQQAAMSAALTHFEPVSGEIAVPPDPKSLPVDKVAAVLDAADMIEGWLNAVRAYGRELVESGVTVGAPGQEYILVAKQGRRKWAVDEADLPSALQEVLYEEKDIQHDDLFERKIKSPAQIEKLLGKKRHGLIKDLWAMESSGTNLVRADKTTREAVAPPALQFFTKET